MRNKVVRMLASVSIIFSLMCVFTYEVQAWQSDNGNGTFTNPVLYADYPDPDIIRVGDDFYMVSTTFADSPGLVMLHSQDLVNWEILSHAATTLDMDSRYDMTDGDTAYRQGMWASSLRHYNGTFYIVVSPVGSNGRIYYANDPSGPWDYYQLDRGVYDPGFLIDDDGTGYIIFGHGPQSIVTLNSNFSAVVSQANNVIDSGGEGSHVVKRGSYYYLFNANPSTWPFQLRCSRARNIFGPWTTGHICLTGTNGGHQGAIVDIDDDDNWYGFVHQDSGAVGRMTRIGPVFWSNNWPVFGTTSNRDVIADTYSKPIQRKAMMQPETSDDFGDSTLRLQWQWNHNPDNTRWSLTERSGFLRLRPGKADEFWTARNTLTQKSQGPKSHGIVKMDISHMQAGDIAGFGTLGTINGYIYVTANDVGNKTLGMVVDDRIDGMIEHAWDVPYTGTTLYLRTDLDFNTEQGYCSYSTDGQDWKWLGMPFDLEFDITYGTFQGEKYAIFCYNSETDSSTGYVDVDSFTFEDTAEDFDIQRGRPILNDAGTTFVTDNTKALLRGPFASTEWGDPPAASEIEAIKEIGLNAIHLYGECFDPDYPRAGSTSPGYSRSRIDDMVEMTREAGLYLIITIGNGSNNGDFNFDYVMDFWRTYAPRYKNETHVLYEIQNEPHAWSAPYPQDALDMEADAYTLIRSLAPQTPILLCSFAVLGSGSLAVTDVDSISTAASVDWSNAAVAFHGYAGYETTTSSLETILDAGYPCFMTEFTARDWAGQEGLDVELTAELERLNVSWLTFQHIPPNFIASEITDDSVFKDFVNRAGMSWTPDYGTWPVKRRIYNDDNQPWTTTGTWQNNTLVGSLRIEAEDFDSGGQDVSYSDADGENWGLEYRVNEGVDIVACSDSSGDYAVSETEVGEWLEYTLYVNEPGMYDLDLRYTCSGSDGGVQIFSNDQDVSGQWLLPQTAGRSGTWVTESQEVFLEFGRQKLRLEVLAGGFELNWMELAPVSQGPLSNGTYKLLNGNSAMAMENNTGTNTVVQDEYLNTSSQQWTLQHLGASQYKVTSARNGYSWNVSGGPGKDLDLVWWWGIDSTSQRFIVRPSEGDFYRIAPVNLGFDFEVEGASQSTGAAILQNEYKGAAYQQWGVLSLSDLAFPTNLNASVQSTGQVDLAWDGVSGADSYDVKRGTISGGPYTVIATDITSTQYTDADVVDGQGYYYVVYAVSGRKQSIDSLEATTASAEMHVHLEFDDGSGTTASDSSGNGWIGSLVNGASWSTGINGSAVELDGSNDYIDLPDGVVDGLSEVTFSVWLNLDSASSWSRVFDFGTGTSVNLFLTPDCYAGARFAITTDGSDGEQTISIGEALPTRTWTHVAITLDGSTGIFYLDGEEVGRNSAMTLTPDSLGNMNQNYIGKSQYSWDPYLDGVVDDFRVYAEALDSSALIELAEL